MTLAIIHPHAGETLSVGAITMRILEAGDHTGHRLGIVEVTIPPRMDGPPQHIHHEHDETFFVISGTLTFTSGSETITAQPGALIVAPPGIPHTFANPGDDPVVVLGTVTPHRYIGYFRELAELHQGSRRPHPQEIAALMARYATEIWPTA